VVVSGEFKTQYVIWLSHGLGQFQFSCQSEADVKNLHLSFYFMVLLRCKKYGNNSGMIYCHILSFLWTKYVYRQDVFLHMEI